MATAQASSFVLQFASRSFWRGFSRRERWASSVAIAIVGALSIVQPSPPEYDRTRARSDGEVAVSVFTGNAIISVFRSILIAGVAFLGGRFLGDDGVRGVFPVLGLSPIVSIPGDLPLKFFLVNLCVPLERPPLLPD